MIPYETVLVLLVGLNVGYGDVISKSMVTLQNNRYSGIVIAINPNVTEDPSLVDAIKKTWTEASPALFTATRSRAYFGDITILIPSTWSTVAFDEIATRESYDAADVLIANPNPSYGDSPYTLQYGGCGSTGSYIHLTPDYLKLDYLSSNFGPRAKALVHEWAHYRWGVFDETDMSHPFYDDPDGNVLKSFYDNQSLSYTQCSKDTPVCCMDSTDQTARCVPGSAHCKINPTTGLYSETCTCYLPDTGASVEASIMAHQYLDEVVTFCEDFPGSKREHNKNAPNDQNRLCNLRSTWNVISDSADFYGANYGNSAISNVNPTFTVKMPEANKRYVLVLDVSGSMGTLELTGETRIEMANKAAAYFINTVPDGSLVSIVMFSSSASTIVYLYTVNNQADRNYLIARIPKTSAGGTCISCGISEAIDVLELNGNPAGGYIIVMTDGIGTMDAAVSNEAINKGVIVETLIIYTAANDELVQLTLDTGGSWFFARSDDLLSLINAYGEFADPKDGDVTNKNLEVYSETLKLDPSNPTYSTTIAVDSTIGKATIFTYTWSSGTISLGVTLTSPFGPGGGTCGTIYSSPTTSSASTSQSCADISIDTSNKMMVIAIKGTAQVGMWQSDISIPTGSTQTVSIIVNSKASSDGVDPIMAESSVEVRNGIPIIYAKVTQGMDPVFGANVTATVSVQGATDTTQDLYDAGADPDIRRNDGIYSRYVTGIGTGRYSVKVRVESQYGGFSGTVVRGAFSRATYNPGYYLPNGTVMSNPYGATFLPKGTIFGVSALDLGNFTRQASAGAFDYTATSASDNLPPSRVLDLSARQNDFNDVSKGIAVTFTAPGDDYDSGSATRYEIRYTFGSPQDLVNNFAATSLVKSSDVIEGNIYNPQAAGVSENFVIVTPIPSGSAATSSISIGFALKTYDEANNEAQISNVANLRYYIQPPSFAVSGTVTTAQPTSTPTTASPIAPQSIAMTTSSTTNSPTTAQSTVTATTTSSPTTTTTTTTTQSNSPTTTDSTTTTTASSSTTARSTAMTTSSTTNSPTTAQSIAMTTTTSLPTTTQSTATTKTTSSPSTTESNINMTTESSPTSAQTTTITTTAAETTTSSCKDCKSYLLWLWITLPIVIFRGLHQ